MRSRICASTVRSRNDGAASETPTLARAIPPDFKKNLLSITNLNVIGDRPLTHHPSPITHHPSLITHHSSLITHHSSLITHHSSLITHHSSLITHHSSLITSLYCL